MTLRSFAIACGTVCALSVSAVPAYAGYSGDVIRIGFITDMSSVYADIDGPAGEEAIKMAVADFGGKVGGKKIEVLAADHQNKPELAAAKAREWFEQQEIDVLIGGSNSGAALAMAKVAAEKQKPYFVVAAGSSALTNDQCTPYTVHYAYDTVALAKGTGAAVVEAGGKSWFFLTADYAFGRALQNDTVNIIRAAGGTVVGVARHPLASNDFAPYMQQILASKAQILGLANAGGDTINAIKAATQAGVTKTMKLAALLVFINDIHSLGLETAQGLYLTDSWYWNQSPEARAWSRRFYEKIGRMPSSAQAADYSVTFNYLSAVKAVGSDDGDKVLAHLRKTKISDMYTRNGFIRPDGRMVHDMYLMQVKTPAQSVEPWDYYNVIETIKGDAAFTTKDETKCPLWR